MQKYISEARLLLALAIPVILAQIAQTAMGFVDTVMAGGYSATDMAAVAIGTSIWLPAILFGHGLLLALTPVIAQLNGSGRRERIAHQVRQGFWLAGFVSVLIMLVLWNAGYIIRSMENIDPALADKAVGYLRALLWGAPGYLFFQVARNQCEGLAKTKPGMVMGFIGLLVNIPVNYIFIYGHFGMPELGGVGCGVATAAVYWVMFLAMVSYIKRARSMRDIRNEKGTAKPDPAVMKRLIQLGLPIALALFFEVTLFAVVALLVSPLGIVDQAMMGVGAVSPWQYYTPVHTSYTFFDAIPAGIRYGWDKLVLYVKQFRLVFTKEGAQSVGGFGAISNMFAPVWSWPDFWHMTAFLSLVLAFMNFLPIPALDGGYILFLLWEIITGRKPSDKFLEIANTIGFWLLLALMIFANGNDIFKAFF